MKDGQAGHAYLCKYTNIKKVKSPKHAKHDAFLFDGYLYRSSHGKLTVTVARQCVNNSAMAEFVRWKSDLLYLLYLRPHP